jgi:hypothetical protein
MRIIASELRIMMRNRRQQKSMSDGPPTIAHMFESIELLTVDDFAGLDDLGLVDAVTVAMVLEAVALEVRLAAIEEMSARLRAVATTRPGPPRLTAAARPPSNRRSRRRRKRKRRR